MDLNQNHNYLSDYEDAIVSIERTPDSPELKCRAVLALARAGSLEFALAEYKRYGLDQVTEHTDLKLLEDIMALGGRLLKDLALQSTGAKRVQFAKQSARHYAKAFKVTGGYYSGINAASMALLAGQAAPTIAKKAKAVLAALPTGQALSREDVYYSLATRAEALLLLGEKRQADALLGQAIEHDPLNYTAHASTLKQFSMILQQRAEPGSWVERFSPPKAAHYAGHMFSIGDQADIGVLTATQSDDLVIQISDAIQKHDIGFGFGALAAGSDILIAETMLEEGVQLHVVLPVDTDLFIEHSVSPYGVGWVNRFKRCMALASSVDVMSQKGVWPAPAPDCFSRQVAMGKAILQAKHLCVDTIQMLIWDGEGSNNGTASGGENWLKSGRKQIAIPYPGLRSKKKGKAKTETQNEIQAILSRSDETQTTSYSYLYEAVIAARNLRKSSGGKTKLGLHIGVETSDADHAMIEAIADQLANSAVPGGVLASEAFVCLLLLQKQGDFSIDYMGQVDGGVDGIRAFTLRSKE